MAAEQAPAPKPIDRQTFLNRLKDALKRFFRQKVEKEKLKELEEAQEKKHSHESPEVREKELKRREQEDKKRKYHEARSAEIEEAEVKMAQIKRSEDVNQKLKNIVENIIPEAAGSGYLVDVIRRNTNTQQTLNILVSENPAAAETVNNLLTQEVVHGSSRELIKLAQRLTYEVGKTPQVNFADLTELLAAISQRAKELIIEEIKMSQRAAARQQATGPQNAFDYLERDSGIIMTDEERENLRKPNIEDWYKAIDSLITTKRELKPEVPEWIKNKTVDPRKKVAAEAVAPVDQIWGEVKRREESQGGKLTTKDLIDFDRDIREAETKLFPKDVQAGTDAYNEAVKNIKAYTEDKLNILAKELEDRLKKEGKPLREGINDPEEFLKELLLNKGALGRLFHLNPAMERLFLGTGTESGKFRNRVFIKIHDAVISDQRNSSQDNFGLYERVDFTTFIGLLRVGLSKIKIKETGENLGQTWADYYNNLSNAIRQSRDIDYWASQPAATIENFNRALGIFQNEYTYHAMTIPAVAAAFRAYETSLRCIMNSNDGYIPPALIEYNAVNKGSFWDQRSKEMLKQKFAMGVVPEIDRDDVTYLHAVDEDGHSLKIATDKNGNVIPMEMPSDDERDMYMVLAKGIGMASLRYLEMFAQARVPGSKQPEKGIQAFHSMAYEGVAKSLNYMNIYIHKWNIGSYKYYHLMNMLVPDEKRLKTIPNDSTEAVKALMAYQDGDFEEKYGEKAKRFMDMLNISNVSSALGKSTLWRQYGSTLGWSDRKRELLGGPTQLALADRFANEAQKNFLVVDKYREQYRQEIIKKNQQTPGLNLPVSGSGFEKLWQEYGEGKYAVQITHEYDGLLGKHPAKGVEHTAEREKTHHLQKAYANAFKARVWVEMAMRNPLIVAHNLKIDVPRVGTEGSKKMRLHNMLVNEILGIPPEDTKYGELYGKTAFGTSPEPRQKNYMIAVLQMEGDLAAVREIAINEGRDLQEADFNIIKDRARQNQALEYWRKVRQVILGSDDPTQAEKLYERFGLNLLDNGTDYAWNYEQIHKIDETLTEIAGKEKNPKIALTIIGEDGEAIRIPVLLNRAVNTEFEWIMGTDDMAMDKMDWLNLGSRQWLRRGGDIASHEAGGNAFTKYLVEGLTPKPDKHELAKILKELRNAYMGDSIDIGTSVAGNLAYMTDRLYAWDWNRLGSAAQLDVWKTRRRVDAWLANGRREWWDTLEHTDVLPPHDHFYAYDISVAGSIFPEKSDIHTMRKLAHAENIDVWKEFLTLGVGLALAMTIYKAVTARSEEEEGGGGGGHH